VKEEALPSLGASSLLFEIYLPIKKGSRGKLSPTSTKRKLFLSFQKSSYSRGADSPKNSSKHDSPPKVFGLGKRSVICPQSLLPGRVEKELGISQGKE